MKERFLMAGSVALHIADSGCQPTTDNSTLETPSHNAAEGSKLDPRAESSAADVAQATAEKRCVVLLHGYLESMYVWDDFVPLLTPKVRVITVDIPGHGISQVLGEKHSMEAMADILSDMLDALGIERCTMVGHSMGGYITLAFAARHADKLDGLVLLSSSPNPDTELKKENRRREIALVRAGKKDALARVAPETGFAEHNRRRLKSYIEDLVECVHITEDEGIVALLNGMIDRVDQNAMLKECGVSQLFIMGKHDAYIPLEAAEQIVANNPQAEVAWLDESGHMGFIEQPQACADALLKFVCREDK